MEVAEMCSAWTGTAGTII